MHSIYVVNLNGLTIQFMARAKPWPSGILGAGGLGRGVGLRRIGPWVVFRLEMLAGGGLVFESGSWFTLVDWFRGGFRGRMGWIGRWISVVCLRLRRG